MKYNSSICKFSIVVDPRTCGWRTRIVMNWKRWLPWNHNTIVYVKTVESFTCGPHISLPSFMVLWRTSLGRFVRQFGQSPQSSIDVEGPMAKCLRMTWPLTRELIVRSFRDNIMLPPISNRFVILTIGLQVYLLISIWHLEDHIAPWRFWNWNNGTVFNHESCTIPSSIS